MSLAGNPGTSINFDGAALQNQQEAEYRKEEEQQQHELRQLLTNAFDDLIDDDDILSINSEDGTDSRNVSLIRRASNDSFGKDVIEEKVEEEPAEPERDWNRYLFRGAGGPMDTASPHPHPPPARFDLGGAPLSRTQELPRKLVDPLRVSVESLPSMRVRRDDNVRRSRDDLLESSSLRSSREGLLDSDLNSNPSIHGSRDLLDSDYHSNAEDTTTKQSDFHGKVYPLQDDYHVAKGQGQTEGHGAKFVNKDVNIPDQEHNDKKVAHDFKDRENLIRQSYDEFANLQQQQAYTQQYYGVHDNATNAQGQQRPEFQGHQTWNADGQNAEQPFDQNMLQQVPPQHQGQYFQGHDPNTGHHHGHDPHFNHHHHFRKIYEGRPYHIPLREETEGGNVNPLYPHIAPGYYGDTFPQHGAPTPDDNYGTDYPNTYTNQPDRGLFSPPNVPDTQTPQPHVPHNEHHQGHPNDPSKDYNQRQPNDSSKEYHQRQPNDSHRNIPSTSVGDSLPKPPTESDFNNPLSPKRVSLRSEFEQGYKVGYHRDREEKANDAKSEKEAKPGPDNERVEKEFMQQGGTSEGQQLAQLQILYKARGRKVDELTNELEVVQNSTARDIRILKHQMSVAKGEKEGAGKSLDSCQDILAETKSENAQLIGRVHAAESQIEGLKKGKDDLIKKLQTAESSIESLTQHMEELGSSDTLQRARHDHDVVVAGLQKKYDTEIKVLKEQIDKQTNTIQEQATEISKLKQSLGESVKTAENAQISRAETMNRLTQSLEESQKRCRNLLESSSSQDMSQMKIHLQQAMASRTISDEMCSSLQDEIKDLKEQLQMMESATTLGIFSQTPSTGLFHGQDDSMVDLGIKKTLDYDTPQSTPVINRSHTQSNVSGDVVSSLKSELERCLLSNRQKRQQVLELKTEVTAVKKEMLECKQRCDRAEILSHEQKRRITELEACLPGDTNAIENRLNKDVINLKKEKKILLEDIEELQQRLQEVSRSEEKLTELNRELSTQIANMVQEYDMDKRQALDRAQRAYDQVGETSRNSLRQELTLQFDMERTSIITKYETECHKIKDQLREAVSEIDRVKELYVNLCTEKDSLKASLEVDWQARLDTKMQEVKEEAEKERNLSSLRLVEEFEKRHEDDLEKLKQDLNKENEETQNNKLTELRTEMKSENDKKNEEIKRLEELNKRSEADKTIEIDNLKEASRRINERLTLGIQNVQYEMKKQQLDKEEEFDLLKEMIKNSEDRVKVLEVEKCNLAASILEKNRDIENLKEQLEKELGEGKKQIVNTLKKQHEVEIKAVQGKLEYEKETVAKLKEFHDKEVKEIQCKETGHVTSLLVQHEGELELMKEKMKLDSETNIVKLQESFEDEIKTMKDIFEIEKSNEIAKLDKDRFNEVEKLKQEIQNIEADKTAVIDKIKNEKSSEIDALRTLEISKYRTEIESLKDDVDRVNIEKKEAMDRLVREKDRMRRLVTEDVRQELEGDMKKTLETKVAMSKVVWLEEHRATRQTAIDNAVRLAEAELRNRMDQDIEIKVEKKIDENKLQWQNESLSQLQNERANWEALKQEELEARVEDEHARWRQTELANELEAERQKCTNDFEERLEYEKESWKVVELETERLSWTLDWEQKLKSEKDTWVRSILEPAKQKWRLETEERLRMDKDNWRCMELEPEKLKLMQEFEDRVKREKQTWLRREMPGELDKEKAKLEKLMGERLRQERESWRTTELPRHLENERRKWVEHVEEKMREERKNWKNSDLPEEIEKERKKWMKLMEATLAKERDKWRNHDLPTELDKEKQKWDEKMTAMFETRLADKLTAEKDKLQKDSEMRVLEAIEEHQEACKVELKHQIAKEKERLAIKTEAEIQERYAAEKKIWKEMVDQELNQKLDIEREKWKQKSECDIQKKLESEKERLRSYLTADMEDKLRKTAEKLQQNLDMEYEEKMCKEIERHKADLNDEWKEKYDDLKMRLEHEAEEHLEMEQEVLRSMSEHELNRKLESEEGNWKKQFEKQLNLKLQMEEEKWKDMIESDIQTRLQHERDKWSIRKNMECEKRIEEEKRAWEMKKDLEWERKVEEERMAWEMKKELEWERRLDEESQKWWQRRDHENQGAESQLTENVSAQMKEDLDREMEKFRAEVENEYHRRLEHEVGLALEDAREDWHREHTMEMSINVTSAEASQGLLREEMESIKQRNDSLQSEIRKREEDWIKEKQDLTSQKDAERRRGIAECQEQSEAEYKQFIMEHQNTLEQALKATREQHNKEKLELEQRFSEELKCGQSREQNIKDQLQDTVHNTKDQTDALMELEKERISWFEERDRLLQDISDRDTLLGKADVHLSKEVDKLRNELQAAYQRRLDTELSSWKQKIDAEFNRVNNAEQKEKLQLEKQLSEVSNEVNKLRSQSKEETGQYQEEIKRLTNDLNESVQKGAGLDKLEADLRRAKELCKEFQELAVEHQEKCHKYKQEGEEVHTRLSRAAQNQEKLQTELHKNKEDKTALIETIQSMEMAYRKDMTSCKQKQEESAGRIAKTEKVLLDMKHKYRGELEKLRAALEAENDVAMDAMKNKMVELQKRHVATMDELKRKHLQDKEHMTVKRSVNINPSSAKAEEDIDEAVMELRTQYLDTVTKIKDDVLRHITETNVRAAETVKHEMAKERTSTFQQIKEFYKDNVRQILETEIIGSNLESKLLAVEEALETLSSAPTSRSTTPKSDDFLLDSDRSNKPRTRSTPRDSSRDAGISPKGSRQVSFTSAKDVSIDRSRTPVNPVPKERGILSSERFEHVYADDPKSRVPAKSPRDVNVSLRERDVRSSVEWDYDPVQKDVDTRSSQNRPLALAAKSPRGEGGVGNRSLPLKPHDANITLRERPRDRDREMYSDRPDDRQESRQRRHLASNAGDKKKSRVVISSRDVHSGRYTRPAGTESSFRSKSVVPDYLASHVASTPSLYRPSSVPDLTEDKDLKLWNETNNDTYRYTSLRDTLRTGSNLRRNNSKSESDLRIAEQSGFAQLQEYDSINLDLSTGSLSSCDTLSSVGQIKTRDAGEVLTATPKKHKSRRYKTFDSFPIHDNTSGEFHTMTRDDYHSTNTRTPHRTTSDDVNTSFQPTRHDDINTSFQPTAKDDFLAPTQSTPKERRNLPLIQFRHGKMQHLHRERVISSKSPHHDEPPPGKDSSDRHYRPLSVSSTVHMDF